MSMSPSEKQARYRQRQRERREAEERERRDSTLLSLTAGDLNRIIAEATETATRAAIAQFAVPGRLDALEGRTGREQDDDDGEGRGDPKNVPTPPPDADFEIVGGFAGSACRDCYMIGAIAFLDDCEARFRQDGSVPDDPDRLRALIGLLMRRIRWTEWGTARALFDGDAPFRSAILRKLHELDGRA